MVWQDYLLLLLLGGTALYYLINQKRRPKKCAATRTGSQMTRREQSAWRKLQAQGYRLEEIHPQIPIAITANEKQKDFTWEGNFTVTKGGKTYLVRAVKGDVSLASVGLRRELLLDYLVFQPRGIFLYDGEKEQLQEVDFIFDPGGGGSGGRKQLLVRVSLIVLIILGLAFLYRLVFF